MATGLVRLKGAGRDSRLLRQRMKTVTWVIAGSICLWGCTTFSFDSEAIAPDAPEDVLADTSDAKIDVGCLEDTTSDPSNCS